MTAEQIERLKEWHRLTVKIHQWKAGMIPDEHKVSKMADALNLLGKVLGVTLVLGESKGARDFRKIYLGDELISDVKESD